jgi:RNA polymerase sigma-70 factor (ECF subfamily)
MAEASPTRASLLLRVRDATDDRAWAQFVQIYAPLIYGFARKKGLQDADAADLTQDVLAAVASAIRRLDYDPERGSFRGWLFTAVRHRLQRYRERRGSQMQGSGDTEVLQLLAQQPGPEGRLDWDEDYERRLFHWAAEQVRPVVAASTWQAFWLTAVEGRAPREVARQLDLAVATVYMAKSRVLARPKALIRQVQGDSHEA